MSVWCASHWTCASVNQPYIMDLIKMFGLEFAPLHTPLRRRLQTLAALAWILTLVVGGAAGWVIWAALVYFSSTLRIPLLAYAVWIYLDRHTAETGARRSKWCRNWWWWKLFSEYFPAHLVKTADLPSDKNYILATFPHGVLCSGAFCAFAADCCNFQQQFPGLRSYILTLSSHFNTPFIRELVLFMGSLPASASCIRRTLESEEKGQALCLMVGGAREALYTHPGTYKVYLKARKGFVKLALETGASLVPVIAFGEPELYDQVETEGTWLRTFQDLYKKFTGIVPLLFLGRGVFQYSFGIVPRRHSLHVVVGKPIDVKQTVAPSEEHIDQVHQQFVKSLQELFDAEKSKYLPDPKTELIVT